MVSIRFDYCVIFSELQIMNMNSARLELTSLVGNVSKTEEFNNNNKKKNSA